VFWRDGRGRRYCVEACAESSRRKSRQRSCADEMQARVIPTAFSSNRRPDKKRLVGGLGSRLDIVDGTWCRDVRVRKHILVVMTGQGCLLFGAVLCVHVVWTGSAGRKGGVTLCVIWMGRYGARKGACRLSDLLFLRFLWGVEALDGPQGNVVNRPAGGVSVFSRTWLCLGGNQKPQGCSRLSLAVHIGGERVGGLSRAWYERLACRSRIPS
jgi:hypothetical protein